jgi:hypothetical protein
MTPHEKAALLHELEGLMDRETCEAWLKTPNPSFSGSSPLQVIERGETDRLWRMIYQIETGEPV